MVTPDNGVYNLTIEPEYLITVSGTDINAGTQLNLFDPLSKGSFNELMTWNSNRWEYLFESNGRNTGPLNLQVMFGNLPVADNIQIQWGDPIQGPTGTGGMN